MKTKIKFMKIKVKNGRWEIGNLYDRLISSKFDIYINSFRVAETTRLRSKISKENNYQFKIK